MLEQMDYIEKQVQAALDAPDDDLRQNLGMDVHPKVVNLCDNWNKLDKADPLREEIRPRLNKVAQTLKTEIFHFE